MPISRVVCSGGVFDDHRQEVVERLQQAPVSKEPQAPAPSRWTLQRLADTFGWLSDYSLSGLWRILQRYGICLRSGRIQHYSPDPAYTQKVERLLAVLREAIADSERTVITFLDEMGYGRWPEAAPDWTEPPPAPVPVAKRLGSNERKWRLIGALNALTGQVQYLDNYIVGRKQVIQLLKQVDQAYPQAQRIYVVLDNWSIHQHEDVQAALLTMPRVQLVWLPTYAPWLNPIEKLWRKFRQEIWYLHQQADDWKALQERVHAFFDQFACGSSELLRYVGLLGDGKLATALCRT